MPGTGALPADGNRWRFPRYFAPASNSFYFDYGEIYEAQVGESESPFRLVANHDAAREYTRDALAATDVRLAGCGYVRCTRGMGYRFAGCHLNISFNTPGFAGCRTAMTDETVQQVMLFFLATNQPWEGIGMHCCGDWQLRSRAIATDISNSCSENRGLLQPGRSIPPYEVKEHEVFHYTHYESGLARSQYQRALAAAVVAIDLHLACHHAREVARWLDDAGLILGPDTCWHHVKSEMSRTLGGGMERKVRVGQASFTLTDFLALRLQIYDWQLREALQIPWVRWAVDQLHALRGALMSFSDGPCGPLWGLDSIVKREFVYRPWVERKGLELGQLWNGHAWSDVPGIGPAREPEVHQCLEELFGFNLLYHDYGKPGLYEDVLAAHPEVARAQQLPQVAELRAQSELPATRAARRDRLARVYADLHVASRRRITPCFAGFDRIALMVQDGSELRTCLHYLRDVLASEVSAEDVGMVRRMAGLVKTDPEPILQAHGIIAGGACDAPGDRPVA